MSKEKIRGRIERHEKGYGFLIPEEEGLEDVFIPPGRLSGAISGDRVVISREKSGGGDNPVGKVLNILERKVEKVVGTIRISRDRSVVIPDTVRLGRAVRVPDQFSNSRVDDGDLVEVEIENYQPLEGVIVDVLGQRGDPQAEERLLLKKYSLSTGFPEAVEQAAAELPSEVESGAKEDRKDLTDREILTVDPKDAKDLDDAVSVNVTGGGNYRIGVHITDVSHYVDAGSTLDEAARERATSTYLAERVVPMFPKEFSNGIGSLDEAEERLAITVFLIVDPSGEVIEYEFETSLIEIDACLSYEQVDNYLETGEAEGKLSQVADSLDTMVDISQKMRARRMDRGSLNFDLPEVRLECHEGEVEEIIPVEHTLSHQLIEEFMIAANEAVARYLTNQNVPLLYRVHEPPADDDVDEFARFVQGLGYNVDTSGELHPSDFQEVIAEARGKTEENVIAWNMLRTLQKARYSPDNLGHFGLASECYCHFTSPIRRYPDLYVHRILKRVLRGGFAEEEKSALRDDLPEMAQHTSEQEEQATEAERESVDVKLLQYMEDKVGEEREVYITSVLEFGCFAQLENTLEGLIHVSTLDDYYVYNESDFTLIGEQTGQTLHIGDRVKVKIARVDVPSRELDFELLEVLESHWGQEDG